VLTVPSVLGPLTFLAACGGGVANETAENTAAPGSAEMNAMAPRSGGLANMAMPVAAKTAKGAGTVKAIDKAAGTITLDHGPLPEAGWPAMTMTFRATPAVLANAKEGGRVWFDVTLANGSGEVTSIRKR
jgi:Cu/Ag efflux protein CusF